MELNRSRQRVTGDLTVDGNITLTGASVISTSSDGLRLNPGSGTLTLSGATTFTIRRQATDEIIVLTGGNGNDSGGNIVLRGSTQSSDPGRVQLRFDGTDRIVTDGTGIGFFGAAPVAQPSAYTPTNVSADRAYDANSTTTAELADVLGTLISDLQGLGLVG